MVSLVGQAKLFGRLAVRLRPFLRSPIDAEQAQAMCRRGLADRAASFLRLVERGVYPDHGSPYRRLLDHAGIEFEDLRQMVQTSGLESTTSWPFLAK